MKINDDQILKPKLGNLNGFPLRKIGGGKPKVN
jgi:hypothetical protein